MDFILPWHHALWQQTLRRWQQGRLPHALLLTGPIGMGKALFVKRLTATLLCEQPQAAGQSCGQCKGCQLLQAATHPDLLLVEPAQVGKPITVDQIRELVQFCSLTAHYKRYQIIIIQPAEAMNHNAANSLLKLLEEPPASTLLMLISHQPMALLATIRSRCQRLDFSRPDPQLTQTWLHNQIPASTRLNIPLLLNLSAQAPLAALALVQSDHLAKRQQLFETFSQLMTGKHDPIEIAHQWLQMEAKQVLQWILSWTMDMIRYQMTRQVQYLVNQDWQQTIPRLATHLELANLFTLLELQQEAYRLINGNSNIKAQGLLENIAITWFEFYLLHHKSQTN
jgi:DNA polymerase-3 subunit delta'